MFEAVDLSINRQTPPAVLKPDQCGGKKGGKKNLRQDFLRTGQGMEERENIEKWERFGSVLQAGVVARTRKT